MTNNWKYSFNYKCVDLDEFFDDLRIVLSDADDQLEKLQRLLQSEECLYHSVGEKMNKAIKRHRRVSDSLRAELAATLARMKRQRALGRLGRF